MVKKLSMESVQSAPQRDRATDEAKAQRSAKGANGHQRLRLGKTEQIIFRVTPTKRQQLVRLAIALTAGKPRPVSYTETMEKALDVLEAHLKAHSQ